MSAHRIFFVDVDGTLVGPDGVAHRVWPALAALRAAGWRVAICTGRPGRGLALDYARRADPQGLHVFESGAAVVAGDGRVVAAAALPPERVAAALSLVGDAPDVTAEAYTAEGVYLAPARTDHVARHEALLGLSARIGAPAAGDTVVRVQWVVPKATWPAFRLRAEALDGVDVHLGQSPKMPDVYFVAATRRRVSKAWGLTEVCARLGVAPADAVMVGDAANDLPALRAVGTPLAVAGGAAEAREAALRVFPSAADGGVADAAAWVLERAGGGPTGRRRRP